jgi:hypothetical protein
MKLLKFRNHKFDTPEARLKMAQAIADMLAVGRSPFTPYKPNEHDDTYWTVDGGNDWKVFFFVDKVDTIGIRYRYDAEGRNPHECAIVPWIMVRLGAMFVVPSFERPMDNPVELTSDEMTKVIYSLYKITPAAVGVA